VIDANACPLAAWKLFTLTCRELSVKVAFASAPAGMTPESEKESHVQDPGPEPLSEHGVPPAAPLEMSKEEIVDGNANPASVKIATRIKIVFVKGNVFTQDILFIFPLLSNVVTSMNYNELEIILGWCPGIGPKSLA
jgi:hypothetical protein